MTVRLALTMFMQVLACRSLERGEAARRDLEVNSLLLCACVRVCGCDALFLSITCLEGCCIAILRGRAKMKPRREARMQLCRRLPAHVRFCTTARYRHMCDSVLRHVTGTCAMLPSFESRECVAFFIEDSLYTDLCRMHVLVWLFGFFCDDSES
jgi:hypothetical protein